MKSLSALYGLAGLLMASSAHAGLMPGKAIYSSFVTNLPDQALNTNYALSTGAVGLPGSPLAQEFTVTEPVHLDSLNLRLSDATAATDGGSILVYLAQSNAGNSLPATISASSNALLGATLLASISDASLPVPGVGGCTFGGAGATINACNTLVPVNDLITTPGNYWIALVDGADSVNGGNNVNVSRALWWRSGDNIGPGAVGLTNAHVNTSGVLTSQVNPPPNAFELQVNTPEPASLAMLGAGLIGLGLGRQCRFKTSAS